MNGRAVTPEQKRDVLKRIEAAWLRNPDLRLGQLLSNTAFRETTYDDIHHVLFYIEDVDLADAIDSYVLLNDQAL